MLWIITTWVALFAGFAGAAPAAPTWAGQMQSLHQSLQTLLPNLVSDKRFNDPKNKKTIERDTATLAAQLKLLDPSKLGSVGPNDADPTLPILTDVFKREVVRAEKELRRGQRDDARAILRTVPAYCIACHSRAPGPELDATSGDPAPSYLSRVDRAAYLAATRRFTAALTEYEAVVADADFAARQPFAWERALRQALTLAIRVKQDAALSGRILEKTSGNRSAASFLRSYVRGWKDAIETWKTEKPKPEKLAEGERLLAQAQSRQRYPADHRGDIDYLRASSAFHDALKSSTLSDEKAALALHHLGVSYEALRIQELGSLHEVYFEACVRRAPKSKYATDCFHRLEESIYAGYTGSAGTEVPSEVIRHLEALEATMIPAKSLTP